ncbi:MAG: MAPEG family protein [Sphingorhabdus sp.]|nr:MAPEG family protein [Sphingorhabdus sp.]
MDTTILAPAAVLVAWSLFMLAWLAVARFGAAAKLGSKEPPAPGLRGQDIDPMLGTAAWKSHNYTHLMEQPTIFYATVFILHIAGAASPLMVKFAWAYVALRIIHSLYQAVVNKVMVRFSIFALSTVCLVVLAVNAVMATL